MFNMVLYLICLVMAVISWTKDKGKTRMTFKKAWRSFENILPQFLGVLVLTGIMLAYLDTGTISKIIGNRSGWSGVIIAALFGAITLIPGFVAFPTVALLLKSGAGMMQMAVFVSALMMVGVITMPVEMQYFGRKLTVYRNLLAFLFSFLVAWVMGAVAQ